MAAKLDVVLTCWPTRPSKHAVVDRKFADRAPLRSRVLSSGLPSRRSSTGRFVGRARIVFVSARETGFVGGRRPGRLAPGVLLLVLSCAKAPAQEQSGPEVSGEPAVDADASECHVQPSDCDGSFESCLWSQASQPHCTIFWLRAAEDCLGYDVLQRTQLDQESIGIYARDTGRFVGTLSSFGAPGCAAALASCTWKKVDTTARCDAGADSQP
jgi:hypothetical protein